MVVDDFTIRFTRAWAYVATVADPEAWQALCAALEEAHRLCLAGHEPDCPAGVFGLACRLTDEFSPEGAFCRDAAPALWVQDQS